MSCVVLIKWFRLQTDCTNFLHFPTAGNPDPDVWNSGKGFPAVTDFIHSILISNL